MNHHISYSELRAALTEWQKVKQISKKKKCTSTLKELWGAERHLDFVSLHINPLQKEFHIYLIGGYCAI